MSLLHNLTAEQIICVDQQLDELKTKFNLIDVFYLSNFFNPGGDAWLHASLTSVHKSSYNNLDRIVFVQDCVDINEFSRHPGNAISRLQKLLSKIDISNNFVLIISGNKELAKDLIKVREMYSTDVVEIQHVYVEDLKYSLHTIENQDTFCVLPWKHLYFGTDGKVFPCCQADISLPIGDTATHTVDEIVKSNQFNQLRSNMLSGKRSKECAYCYEQEKNQSTSLRTTSNARLMRPDESYEENPEFFSPEWIEFSINKTCNLKCRMCSGYYSSSIAKEDLQLYEKSWATTTIKQRASVAAQLVPYLHNLRTIDFAGGEPLLAGEHYTILDQLISCGNTDIELGYITNFTSLRYKKYDIFDFWKQFKKVQVRASLDAHGKVAEYVRSGTVWKQIEENLHLLKINCPHVDFWVTSSVGFLNVRSLIELQKSWHTQDLLPIAKFKLHPIMTPEYFTVQVPPEKHKILLEQNIQHHVDWCIEQGAITLASQWQDISKYMWEEDHQHYLEEFKKIISTQDRARNQSFIKIFPEYEDLL